jgi:hypothetical protein
MFFVALLAACGGDPSEPGGGPSAEPTEPEHVVTPGPSYRILTLGVDPETDANDDGAVDNHFPTALATIDALLPGQGFTIPEFDARLTDNVVNWSPVVVDTETVDEGAILYLHLIVYAASFDAAGNVVIDEGSGVLLPGSLGGANFAVGPADFDLWVVGLEGLAPIPVKFRETYITGALQPDRIDGQITSVIPLDQLVAEFVDPMVPPEGWDLQGDGLLEPREEVLAFIDEVSPLLADVSLPDGQPGISVRLDFTAEVVPE